MVLTPVLAPIITLGIVMVTMGDIIFKMITIIPKLLKIALNLFRPMAFIKDLVFGIFQSINMILAVVGDLVFSVIRTIFNTIFGQSLGGIFGHDTQRHPGTGKKFKPKGNICRRPPSLFHYIIMLMCPPLFVFMKKGLRGWIYILIDIALTLMFYFPGLLYAIIICH